VKIKGISPVADHWRTKAEELERSLARETSYRIAAELDSKMHAQNAADRTRLAESLARKEALLRDIEAAMRSPGTNMVGLQTLLKRIERELKG
jgi:hypothetical protein